MMEVNPDGQKNNTAGKTTEMPKSKPKNWHAGTLKVVSFSTFMVELIIVLI